MRNLAGVALTASIAAALLAVLAVLVLFACAGTARPSISAAHGAVVDEGGRVARIALETDARTVALSATGDWRIYERNGTSTLVLAGAGDGWTIELTGGLLRAVRSDGVSTVALAGPFIVRAVERGSFITVAGRRYRGEVRIRRRASGLLVVNWLPVEDYLRGVVPLEIGTARTPEEYAAVAAQAVAARSYTYVRVTGDTARPYDMVATVVDQVYRGADAETPLADSAVAATVGEVLTFGGQIVSAPYSSTCGGSTAAPTEVWRTVGEPYLMPVSDRVSGGDGFYCQDSPRFRWTRTFERDRLAAAVERHLREYVAVSARGVGEVRAVEVDGRTATDRVRALTIVTDRGRYALRGNDMRFVLREPGGEILNSTYFSVESERGADGSLSRLTLRGGGYGHGVGMCQWGAIGRSRAGQDYRTILRTYYPGTTVAKAD